MSRRSTGHVIERSGPRGTVFALRFQAYGRCRYLTLGSRAEGWTRSRAREEMDNILADIRRGAWVCRKRRVGTVSPTATGGRRDKDNLRSRVLASVFDRADELLEERGRVPLPRRLTTHKLRHTFASVLISCGEDSILVMSQLGHTDPAFTLRTYAHLMSRAPGERERLKALVDGERVTAIDMPAGPPLPLDCPAYEPSTLRALVRRGGRGSRREIRAAVADDLKVSFNGLDRERLPSGEPRWEVRFDKRERTLGGQDGPGRVLHAASGSSPGGGSSAEDVTFRTSDLSRVKRLRGFSPPRTRCLIFPFQSRK